MGNENVSDKSTSKPAVPELPKDADGRHSPIDDETYKKMLDILQDLTDHTHIFYDDYSTACNCACACACCIRGMIW